MNNFINVHIYRGDKYYITESGNLPFVTQATTLDVLMSNLKEAVDLTLEGEQNSDFVKILGESLC